MAATRLTRITQELGARCKLQRLYGKILHLTEKLPPDCGYRIHTEAIVCHRLTIINETEDLKEIEEKISGGRVEMLVRQAVGEFELVRIMISHKVWEPLVEKPPPDQWKWPPVLE